MRHLDTVVIDLGDVTLTRFERKAIALGILENWDEEVQWIATRDQCKRFIRKEGLQRLVHWMKILREEEDRDEDDCEEHPHWHTKRCKCR